MTPNSEAFFLEKHITIANQIALLHLFLRQIAISLQRISYFLQRDKQPKGLATRTLTLTFIHRDSCHDSHAFGAYACSFTRARQFCHNVEKYAAETSGPSVNPARGLAEAWFHRARVETTRNSRRERRYFRACTVYTEMHARVSARPFASQQTVRNVDWRNVTEIERHPGCLA